MYGPGVRQLVSDLYTARHFHLLPFGFGTANACMFQSFPRKNINELRENRRGFNGRNAINKYYACWSAD